MPKNSRQKARNATKYCKTRRFQPNPSKNYCKIHIIRAEAWEDTEVPIGRFRVHRINSADARCGHILERSKLLAFAASTNAHQVYDGSRSGSLGFVLAHKPKFRV